MEIDPTWDIAGAIRKQVDKEDLHGWALRENHYDPEAMRKELPTGRWSPTAEFVFSRLFKKIAP